MTVPAGTICIWSGNLGNIPDGWTFCDGTNGTPDLQNRFVVCTGVAFPLDSTGGSFTHLHSVTTNPHNHTIPSGGFIGGGGIYEVATSQTAPSGATDEVNHLPPYYTLAYIMKL